MNYDIHVIDNIATHESGEFLPRNQQAAKFLNEQGPTKSTMEGFIFGNGHTSRIMKAAKAANLTVKDFRIFKGKG